MIEPLESRVAPATLVNPTTVTFRDIDGDNVTIKVTKPIFTEANVNSLLGFVGGFDGNGPQTLSSISFASLPESANGIGVTITAKRSPIHGGNNAVYISAFNASNVDNDTGTGLGIDLGKVSIQGEVAYIDAGDTDPSTPAIVSLKTHAIGLVNPGVESEIYGPVGSITTRGSVGGYIHVAGGNFSVPGIGKLTIGGSLIGSNGTDTGRINAFIGFGSIVVKGDIIGGDTQFSGCIQSANKATSVTVGGTIIGGDGEFSGSVRVSSISNLKVTGSIVGGDGSESGIVRAYTIGITKGFIGGSIIGGAGSFSGRVVAGDNTGIPGNIGNLLIKGSILGLPTTSGLEGERAGVYANGSIQSLTILGDVSAANIIAGVKANGDGSFGSPDDANDTSGGAGTISTIAKLIIKGTVSGTVTGGDFFGIEANKFLSVQVGPSVYKNTNPAINFSTGVQLAPGTGDVLLREVN